jgi:hypothetical protein
MMFTDIKEAYTASILRIEMSSTLKKDAEQKTPVALVCERTIPTEGPPLVGEVSANFYG